MSCSTAARGCCSLRTQTERLLRCSRALTDRFGPRLGEGATLASLVAQADREKIEALVSGLEADDQSAACTVHIPDSSDAGHSTLCCALRRAASGTLHGHFEAAAEVTNSTFEHVLFKAMINTLDVVLWAIEPDGTFVFHDGKGLASAGLEPGQFLGANIFEIYPADMVAPIREALGGTPSDYTSEAHEVHWHTWNLPLRDGSGEVTHTAGLSLDITRRVESARELDRQLATIRSQQRAIHELSAPLINVWDQVMTVPLIGGLDSDRTDELTDRLLAELHRSRTRFAILDLTGVDAVDTSIASHILRLLDSMRLLGVEGMVTGVSPQVAQTMVGVGIDFENVQTHRSLREGLRYCMRALVQQ